MDKCDLFLDKYKELENLTVSKFNLGNDGKAIFYLENQIFKKYKNEIAYCREVRNLLQHKPKIDASFAVEPSDKMLALIDSLISKVDQTPNCMEIAIPLNKIYWRTMDDLVIPTMHEMKKQEYMHVPILLDGKVIGVFSDNSIFSYLLDKEIIELDKGMTFHAIAKYLPLEAHVTEKFRFIKQDSFLYEIEDLFEEAFRKNERLGMLFVTAHGKEDEKILGLLTPWEVLGVD